MANSRSSIAILQARTTSARLPGKVLLPIAGIPLVVLAARRAANAGMTVVVATSTDASDDALARLLATHGISCFRGSLTDTLQRFVGALTVVDDDATVFRLTGDNVVPDGALLKELESQFRAQNLDYFSCSGPESGLPYGVSVEVTKARHMRAAHAAVTSASDREHVTPFIRRRFGAKAYTRHAAMVLHHLRCTVDTLEDYLVVERLFSGLDDPVTVPWHVLVVKLAGLGDRPALQMPSKFEMGTAQLGMSYGIANRTGMPTPEDAVALVQAAVSLGTHQFDTAQAYGASEKVLGRALRGGLRERVRVNSKLATLSNVPADAAPQHVAAMVEASVFKSLALLGGERIDSLLLHRASHLTAWQGAVRRHLLRLRADGTIGALGVSVQTPIELSQALDDPDVAAIQLPFNILDWRWEASLASVRAARQQRPLVIHARSALLQGLLTLADGGVWLRAGVAKPEPVVRWLAESARRAGYPDSTSFCLAYVRAQDWIDHVVVGIETMNQLQANLTSFNLPELALDTLAAVASDRPRLAEDSLDPARWRPQI